MSQLQPLSVSAVMKTGWMLQFQPLSAASKTVEADVTDTFSSVKDWVDVTIPASFSSWEGCSSRYYIMDTFSSKED